MQYPKDEGFIDIMLDLETMGTGPDAAITAIGAVVFDLETGKLGKTFYEIVNLESSMDSGGAVTASTILWWMKQGDAARGEFARKGCSINVALARFSEWISGLTHTVGIHTSRGRIWGNGAAFDNVILRSAYERSENITPWVFRNDMCFRTIRALWPDVEGTQVGTSHNALDDAKYQAFLLMDILGKLKRREIFFDPPKRSKWYSPVQKMFTRFTEWCKLLFRR